MKSLQKLNFLALKTRRMLGEDSYSPIDIFALVNGWTEKKITIVYYPLSCRISGMCTRIKEDIVICISSSSSYGRQRFTLAHELYHVLYEDKMERVICGMDFSDGLSDSEKEADLFASYLLMPYDALFQYRERFSEWNLKNIIEAEQFFQISHQAMLQRLLTERMIQASESIKYQEISPSKEASLLGYGKALYLPVSGNTRYFTTGEYIRKVETLTEQERISNGKREELLSDAFRADIVYNFNDEDLCMSD